jgi:outer membrane protein assembly factor BamD
MAALQDVVNRFPNTPYARDARLKMDLARDHLAGREMVVGRFYQNRRLHLAAIGRFRRVVEEYQTTNHVPEALHRLTEIYLSLGLVDEARQTASVLGHNYPGSPWYQDSYSLLVEGSSPTEGERPGFFRRMLGGLF